MEADDHAREHVDRKRHPWPLERSACFLVDHDRIHERVINLNDLERPRSCVLAGRRRCRLDRCVVSAFARRQPPFDCLGLPGAPARLFPRRIYPLRSRRSFFAEGSAKGAAVTVFRRVASAVRVARLVTVIVCCPLVQCQGRVQVPS
jgi:hypothetical protein